MQTLRKLEEKSDETFLCFDFFVYLQSNKYVENWNLLPYGYVLKMMNGLWNAEWNVIYLTLLLVIVIEKVVSSANICVYVYRNWS